VSVPTAAAALLLFLAPGFALTGLLPDVRGRALPVRLALGWLLGLAWVAGMLYALSHLLQVALSGTAIGILAALPVVAWLATRPSRRTVRRRRFRPLVLVPLAIGGIASAALFLDAAANPVTDWDGRMTWGAHARHIRAARSVDADTLRNGRYLVFHPRYPALLPVAQAAALEVTGSEDERLTRLLYAAFLPCFLTLVFAFSAPRGGLLVACALTSAAALLPQLTYDSWGAAGLESDLPLGCFLGASFLLLVQRRGVSTPAFLLAAAVLTKSEGLPLAIAALAVCLLPARNRRRLLAPALAIVLAAFFLWTWRAGITDRMTDAYAAPSLAALGRAAGALRPSLAAFLDTQRWGLFWPVAALILLMGRRGLSRPLLLFVALALVFYAGAWALHTTAIEKIVERTLSRFLLQLALPALALLSDALRTVDGTPRPAGGAGGGLGAPRNTI